MIYLYLKYSQNATNYYQNVVVAYTYSNLQIILLDGKLKLLFFAQCTVPRLKIEIAKHID